MRALAIPTADSTARPPGGKQSSVTWVTPPWRTGMGWRWPAWSRSPTALPSAALRRSCSRPKPRRRAAASRWAKIRPMTRPTMWPICALIYAACDAERLHHRNRQASSERHRRTHHAARRLWHVAIVSSDDRMHLRLGQAARHDAQDQTSWPSQRLYRLHAQSDRLQLDPHSQTADGLGQRLFTTSRPPQNPRQKDGQCTNLQVLPQTARAIVGTAFETVRPKSLTFIKVEVSLLLLKQQRSFLSDQ